MNEQKKQDNLIGDEGNNGEYFDQEEKGKGQWNNFIKEKINGISREEEKAKDGTLVEEETCGGIMKEEKVERMVDKSFVTHMDLEVTPLKSVTVNSIKYMARAITQQKNVDKWQVWWRNM